MKHTPGPWKPVKREQDLSEPGKYSPEYYAIMEAVEGSLVAEVHHAGIEWEEFKANARIVAAAPDLLKALKMAIHALQVHGIDETMAGEFEILTNAVAKVEGEDQGTWTKEEVK